jgi:hypothetical protein
MKIYYISIGSFCYAKMVIRETDRELKESLPFDFNSSPHLPGITNILKELYETKTYNIELKEILEIYNENELSVSEKNMYLVHFFKTHDLVNEIKEFPASINYIKKDVIEDVKHKFKKRFEKLLNILNDKNNILCFLRIENYDNAGWKYELSELTKVLSLFKNPNKFLIYAQNLIDNNLHFYHSNVINYDYNFPILFYKYYFYDIEIINNKDHFINLFKIFENILNSEYVINIKNNNIIEKYYLDPKEMKIYKLTNIKYYSTYLITNDLLFINNVINGYEKYKKINNIYVKEL